MARNNGDRKNQMKFSLTSAHSHTDTHTQTLSSVGGAKETNREIQIELQNESTMAKILKFKIFVTCQTPFMRFVIARGSLSG